MKQLVIDASVALKWFLPGEKYEQAALEILHKFVSQEIEIFAPTLLAFEVLNALLIAARRGRIPQKISLMAAEGFFGLAIEQEDIVDLYPKVLNFAQAHGLSVYDASYLALANEIKAELVTADDNLFNKVKRDLKWVKHLGDFIF